MSKGGICDMEQLKLLYSIHRLMVQQVLQELRQFHGYEGMGIGWRRGDKAGDTGDTGDRCGNREQTGRRQMGSTNGGTGVRTGVGISH